jgi:hypothetical protein
MLCPLFLHGASNLFKCAGAQLRAMLEAVSYKKEVIFSALELRVGRNALQVAVLHNAHAKCLQIRCVPCLPGPAAVPRAEVPWLWPLCADGSVRGDLSGGAHVSIVLVAPQRKSACSGVQVWKYEPSMSCVWDSTTGIDEARLGAAVEIVWHFK